MMTIFEKSSNSDHNCNFIIMAYGSTPYVRMAPKKNKKTKKNGSHIKSAQMTHFKRLR